MITIDSESRREEEEEEEEDVDVSFVPLGLQRQKEREREEQLQREKKAAEDLVCASGFCISLFLAGWIDSAMERWSESVPVCMKIICYSCAKNIFTCIM